MAEALVRMEAITKHFPGVIALNQCHFELMPGEVHALVGENGAGKSTMMKILTGVYSKDEGRIFYKGQEVDIPNPKAAQMLGISMIHQELNLVPDLTVAQNLFIGREPRKLFNLVIDERKTNENTQLLLDRIHLLVNPDTEVSELSVSKQQMVEIAKALSFDSDVVIMDEPTAALTDAEINELFEIIRQLRDSGVGIIYISHRMDELKRITDRITVMRDGSYIDTVQTDSVSVDQIISMMVGRQIYQTAQPDFSISNVQETVLEVQHLNRGSLLKDISFKLKKGEILGFSGLMGAGRTELARAIFGADPFDSGEILIHGKKAEIKHPYDAVQYGIGYLSEDRKRFGLMIDLDVKANISMACLTKYKRMFGWMNDQEIAAVSSQMKESLTVKTPDIHQRVGFLSGGNQQKVVIAKWLARDCDILIFDEPTRGIDVGAKGEIYQLLNQLASEGKSIIMISSELPEILRMSHRILVMCEGRITGEFINHDLSQETIMSCATQRIG